ncbi:MAG: hypoxanthine phosphoribosyltransferase [Chloroflexi bacterium]|nr:hypoxanthine phosphoribosyltransferase [Chloroflexota bacterium]
MVERQSSALPRPAAPEPVVIRGPLLPSDHPDIEAILVPREALAQRVAELGAEITADFASCGANEPPPLVIGVLKGALLFVADLVRAIGIPISVDCMRAASYGARTISSGSVQIRQPPAEPVAGRDVLVVDMVLDTGLTLRTIDRYLREQGARSVRYCVLVAKERDGQLPYPVDYVGFRIPDCWVVGYGGDYADRYRNLPYIGILRPEVYAGQT